MKRALQIIGLLLLVYACLPLIHYSGSFDVEVTWSVKEKVPQDREITFKGETFTIPAGQQVVRNFELRGGGNSALLWSKSGFGLGWNTVEIKDYDQEKNWVKLNRLSETGNWWIFGLQRKKTLHVEIELIES